EPRRTVSVDGTSRLHGGRHPRIAAPVRRALFVRQRARAAAPCSASRREPWWSRVETRGRRVDARRRGDERRVIHRPYTDTVFSMARAIGCLAGALAAALVLCGPTQRAVAQTSAAQSSAAPSVRPWTDPSPHQVRRITVASDVQ